MDTVTQFVLGAGVGAAVLGRLIGPRKAAITGGLLGSVPDLDVLFPFDDPIDSFILHRGVTHAFLIHALATPVFGEALVRLFKNLRDQRFRTYLAVFLIFVTHAALDALTIYGTRIFWPLAPDPVGVGSIFIIDPLYTLPLLVITLWAFCAGTWSLRFSRALTVALTLSTAYLGWGLLAQYWAKDKAETVLAQMGIQAERVFATPAPFSTFFWRVVAIDGNRYINLYLPLFGSTETPMAYVHPRGLEHLSCADPLPAVQKLADFSKGFYRVDEQDGEIRVSDLRMGLTPGYAFTFAVAQQNGDGLDPIPPRRIENSRRAEGDIDWLLAN
ncbi:MAG: metal-dependent hydrolase, partial [Pseudomonadota bacterium]